MIGQTVGIVVRRSGFCAGGRGTAAPRSVYFLGIAAAPTPLSGTAISDSVVPGVSHSLYSLGYKFPQRIYQPLRRERKRGRLRKGIELRPTG